jgi:pimeloyl-ACP methyl ester carboxylesterase
MAGGRRLRTSGLTAGLSACLLLFCSCAQLPTARRQDRRPEPVPPTPWSHWARIDGRRVHYVDTGPRGPAQPLLIVHGFLGSTDLFEPFIDELRTCHRVVMPDLPGCGFTSAPRGPCSMEFYLDFLERFRAQLGLQQVVLMGSSMGAQLAVRFAAERPGQVGLLVLCNPFGLAEQQRKGSMRLARSEVLLRLAAPWISRARVRRTLLRVVADDSRVGPQLVDSFWAPFQTAQGRKVACQLLSRVAVRQPLDPLLSRLRLPVLVLLGEEDPLGPPGRGARYAELLPDARVVAFPGVGHLLHVEAPAEAARCIEAFLAEKAD